MEVIADGKTLIHIVNGHEVLRAENPRQGSAGRMVPHMRGKFSLQSEGAEAFTATSRSGRCPDRQALRASEHCRLPQDASRHGSG